MKVIYRIIICVFVLIVSVSVICSYYIGVDDKRMVSEQNIIEKSQDIDESNHEEYRQQLDWNKTEENDWFVWTPGSSYIRYLPEE